MMTIIIRVIIICLAEDAGRMDMEDRTIKKHYERGRRHHTVTGEREL